MSNFFVTTAPIFISTSSEFFNKFGDLLRTGTIDTLLMTFITTFFAYLIGLPFGVLLTTTKKGGIQANAPFNSIFGWVLNIIRSIPFYILMIFMFPFTSFIMGNSIGTKGAILPLVVASIPFIARMVETSLEEVDQGVVEAAQAMGASNFQIITRVMLRESVPSLFRGLSIIIITIIGYTAITGIIGANGLGDIAYRYGYSRYETSVMYATIILLIIIVCVIQGVFNLAAKASDKRTR